MKSKDFFVFIGFALFLAPFFIFPDIFMGYESLNKEHGMLMSFVKFAVLATFGETLGSRIRTGKYMPQGFGLIPRAIIWGLLGFTIQMAFVVFSTGVPIFISKTLGFSFALDYLDKDKVQMMDFGLKLLVAFSISAAMNIIYAPIMMTIHKITDMHIAQNNGKISTLYTPIKVEENIAKMNWNVQWSFVFKRTIPLFWIPAHTITFMLPTEYRVLFAAALGIALGVIMSIASLKSKKN